jgi:phosphomannomutase/phosphoglucomutase
MSIYKACDIRGRFGTELTAEHATLLGHALVELFHPPQVVVGGDGRLSTPELKGALIRALVECGVRVLDIGTLPTPAFYFARARLQVPVGVMVTASHNPAPDNGFKIALGDLPVTEDQLDAIKTLMEAGLRRDTVARGQSTPVAIVEEYVSFIEELCPHRGYLKTVIDSGNGMYGPLAPRVFRDLGFDVVELFSRVDGNFPNRPPNPSVAQNISALCAEVKATNADLGVAYDGDGDRVVFVDERGEPVENDRVIVLFARQALGRHPGSTIVYDQKCSDTVREEIERDGGVPRLAKSGHTFIKAAFLETDAAYAGELSGHHFLKEIRGDDGLLASLSMAALLQDTGQTLSQLAAAIPRYPITPDIRVHVAPGEGAIIIDSIKHNLQGASSISELDGIRAQFADGWGLVRASVTEPAITLRFEGHNEAALQRIKESFIAAAPQLKGRI